MLALCTLCVLWLNHLVLLTIEKLVYGGDGLARLPADEHGRGKAVFVPFVLPGEQVEASLLEQKPGFARAQLDKILQPSAGRIEPGCPYFERCGGCHYQHTGYERQLEIKASILKENLRRIAKLELSSELVIHPSPPWNYRNRSRFKVQTAPQFALGYFKFNSHELLPVESCPISSSLINRAIGAFGEWGRGTQTAGLQEVELFANADDSELLIELHCSPELAPDAARSMAEEVRNLMSEIGGTVAFRQSAPSPKYRESEPELLAGTGAEELTYRVGTASYRVSAGAFFQVNRHLVGELVDLVIGSSRGEVALDLYAGVGLFTTALARRFAQVIAVESSQTSHGDLVENCPGNVKAIRAGTEQFLGKSGRWRPDLIVVDPPRSGLGATVVKGLAALQSPRLAYVSCDPATLARDLSGLLAAGYKIEQAHLVDLFPQTFHLESVFHLVR